MGDYEKLIRLRTAAKSTLTRAINKITPIKDQVRADHHEVKRAREALQGAKEKLSDIHEKLIVACDEDQLDAITADYENEMKRHDDAELSLFQKIIQDQPAPPPTPPPVQTNGAANVIPLVTNVLPPNGATSAPPPDIEIRLPAIELPTFSGDLTEWSQFADIFKIAVHDHPKLKGAQKLQYLKSSLRGEAAKQLHHLQICDINYQEAWDLLTERFENEREIVYSHVRNLLAIPPISNDSSLRSFIDDTKRYLRALKALNQPTDQWDALLNVATLDKLNAEARREWELMQKSKSIPKFSDLLNYLEIRARAHFNGTFQSQHRPSISQSQKPTKPPSKCYVCKEQHAVNQCDKFRRMTVQERKAVVKKNNACTNCLSSQHQVDVCKSGNCRVCNKRHNSLLHTEPKTSDKSDTSAYAVLPSAEGLLATACVNVEGANNNIFTGRALVDQGSQISFIKESFVEKLHLVKTACNSKISGVVCTSAAPKGKVTFTISSIVNPDFHMTVSALVVKNVTVNLPNQPFDVQDWKHIKGLQLADPEFNEPSEIDLLLGVQVWSRIIQSDIIRGPDHLPIAQKSSLGWLVNGILAEPIHNVASHSCVALHDTLRKFWELESVTEKEHFTPEEESCLLHYENSHKRLPNGSYQVKLPLYSEEPDLGDSKGQALQRFASLERKFRKQPTFKGEYSKCMAEYISLGHMEPVPLEEKGAKAFYLPHHAVMKDSTTTKLRIVFDASAQSTNGKSLNDMMMNGPVLQNDIFTTLLRFRLPAIAMTADIEKMYRQIHIDPTQKDLQRIIWRPHEDEPLQEYRLNRLTFGTKAAPFLAIKTIHQLADDEGKNYPLAAPVLKNDSYVDDLLTGEDETSKALELRDELLSVTSAGGFQLRKWMSNDPRILADLPVEYTSSNAVLTIDDASVSVKTLGLRWHPSTDQFSFAVNITDHSVITKRTLLSEASKIYDPLGWLSPITVKGKMLFQKLWLLPLSWDDPLPTPISQSWIQHQNELHAIEDLRIQRRITIPNSTDQVLCGFADASEQGYAAVVYLRSTDESGTTHVNLIAAKTKVAPLKTTSIPRLELNAAVLLTKLLRSISSTLQIESIEAWTDSSVALAWISNYPSTWKTYVANRVAEIQETVSPTSWHHVSTKENPADCASRGISPLQLRDLNLWWNGPEFLMAENYHIDHVIKKDRELEIAKEKRKPKKVANSAVEAQQEPIYQSSSFRFTVRVTAIILRVFRNLRNKQITKSMRLSNYKNKIQPEPLTPQEIQKAEAYHIRIAQRSTYASEIDRLEEGKPLKSTSKLISLSPFLDENHVLRVGGRLKNASISESFKHPILLPPNHELTTQIIQETHDDLFHANVSLLLTHLRFKYWIRNGRHAVRQVIRQCIRCARFNAETAEQRMADLPTRRVTPSRPFSHVGVDYCGPFTLRSMTPRSTKTSKGYVAIFVCYATKAVHIEVVSSLTTDAFLAALRRFIGRRGKPAMIYSDCGTNFIGADRELRKLLLQSAEQNKDDLIAKKLSQSGITWQFNPPSAPHFGGLWEAAVKSFKHHFKRVVGSTILNFEEMDTLATQIEGVLNSRPLTGIPNDPQDPEALTPGHFLVGSAITAHPEPQLDDIALNRLSRWQLVQAMQQQFWRRWSNEYLQTLQHRRKWHKQSVLKEGQLVLIKNENLPPTQWEMGRISQLHPGPDSCVRIVTVKTANGTRKRPIVKIVPLPAY